MEAAEVLRAAKAPVMAGVAVSGGTTKEALGPQGASGNGDAAFSPEDRELVQVGKTHTHTHTHIHTGAAYVHI